MSENSTNNKNVRDDEIDLLDLFRRMGKTLNKWANAIGKAFLITTVFMLRRWIPLGLSVVLGLSTSMILKYKSDSYFTSDLELRNNLVTNTDMISFVNRLRTYSTNKNTIALSEALSVDTQRVKNILEISAYWVIDKSKDGVPDFVDYKNNHDVYDTINIRMLDRMDIRVKIKSTQDLSIIRDGIINFIEHDSLFQQRNRVRLRQISELLARLNYDIEQLDSLQEIKYFEETKIRQPQNGGQMIFLQEQKTQLVYTDIYTLYSKKQALESERDLYKGVVTILSDFSIPTVRDNGGMFYAKTYVPIFFGLTLLGLIILANKRKLNEVYKKY